MKKARFILCSSMVFLFFSQVGYAQLKNYAAGTVVHHHIDETLTGYIDLSREYKLETQMLVDNGTTKRWVMPDPNVKIEEVNPAGMGKTGINVKLTLSKDAWKNKQKKFLITGHAKGDGRQLSFTLADYNVVPLKTVIVAVDGLAYQSINEFITEQPSSHFSKVFSSAINRTKPALSALPSITYTNWPGVLGGRAPKDHGILGNSFFEREKARNIRGLSSKEPFASTGGPRPLENLSVVRGELNSRVRIEASLYDRIAMIRGRKVKAWSVNGFYALSKRPHVDIVAEYYGGRITGPLDLRYHGHNPEVARRLDEASGNRAREILEKHIDELDILTVYFPGPDNVGHEIGAEKNYPDFTTGPSLPNVETPLYAIKDQINNVTDAELGKLVEVIERRGYLNAVLFVLVADHGLHAYKNDRRHNIYLPERNTGSQHEPPNVRRENSAGLEKFFGAMGLSVWKGSDIESKSLVYSPNGGMAHIYIRNTKKENDELAASWIRPAQKKDIEMVARQLFIESSGKNYPECKVPERDMRDKACYSKLTKLKGALGYPPAIFVRVGNNDSDNHFTKDFRWLKDVKNDDPTENVYGSITEFIQARQVNWPAFEERLAEMNDTNPNGSRTGDVVIFTDGEQGYLTINVGDGYHGWHGGATVSESHVPLFFNIAGPSVDEQYMHDLIQPVLQDITDKRHSRSLRNWDLREILGGIYEGLIKISLPEPTGFHVKGLIDNSRPRAPVLFSTE